MTPAPALWPDVRPAPRQRTVQLDRFLVVAVLVSSALRLPGLMATPSSDEAGFLLVARTWTPSADSLYGRYWVDRPPVLLAAYRWSDALVGDLGPRLLAMLLAAVLVVAVHLLATRMVSPGAARVATVVTVTLLADPALSAWTAKGEVLGTPLVAVSWLLLVRALDSGSCRAALLAGVCAMTACGFKQSLVGGLVFAFFLLGASLLSQRCSPSRVARLCGRFAVGVALPVLAGLAWLAVSPATIASAWYQVIGFRADASAVLAASDSQAPVERAHDLIRLFVVCGMAPLAALSLASVRGWFGRWPPLSLALLATTVVDLAGVVVGGSYWHAYLVPLIPDIALLAALAASCAPPFRSLARFVAALAVVATVNSYVGFVEARLVSPTPSGPWQAGHAISLVSARDDTIVSLYGNAELVEASGLPSPYRHLWSLPMRTLDPDQDELRALLSGPQAPTWVVAVLPLSSWHIDDSRRLRDLLMTNYRLLTPRCGPLIWVRGDTIRPRPKLDCP
jgi:4-amino-4-deoxy-L-arabinose transferase-like glycosyltransferase